MLLPRSHNNIRIITMQLKLNQFQFQGFNKENMLISTITNTPNIYNKYDDVGSFEL